MKNFVITQRLSHSAIFAQLPECFRLNVTISRDVVHLDFIDEHNSEVLYGTFFSLDGEGYRSFDDFTKKGQELLLERLSEAIIDDISVFISGEHEDTEFPEGPYFCDNGCFSINAYMDDWREYYDFLTSEEDVLNEYSAPENETDSKK
jgi:hypothetical protein